jgi:hypothetical protein
VPPAHTKHRELKLLEMTGLGLAVAGVRVKKAVYHVYKLPAFSTGLFVVANVSPRQVARFQCDDDGFSAF